MQHFEMNYRKIVDGVKNFGEHRKGRNGGTASQFGVRLELPAGQVPLLTNRKMYPKGVIGELAAMLEGASNVKVFKDYGCNYWDAWAKPDGALELDYGTAWRNFNGVDQLAELVDGLRSNPAGRRHIITGWRPDRLKVLDLPCCHLLYQWYVSIGKNRLDMIWYQRSVDVMVGLPSDMFFAYLFNRLLAQTLGMEPGKIVMMLGDTHIYDNHIDGANEYLQRGKLYECRTDMWLAPEATVFNFKPEMVELDNYNPKAPIKFELNV